MHLHYLILEASDDGEGTGSWDAMASVRPAMLALVLAEIQTVLSWAEANSPGPRGPLDDGGVWDADQHTQIEGEWTTVTLTLTGPIAWGEALLAHFGQEA